MRLAFMGTPDFSVSALRAVLSAGHDVVAVYSQPPRPSGRGKKLKPSPVHALLKNLISPFTHRLTLKTCLSVKNLKTLILMWQLLLHTGLFYRKKY